MNKDQFVTELAKLRPASTFLTLKGYRNEASEVSDFSIAFHISYKTALERSQALLKEMELSTDLEKVARDELLFSFQRSLNKLEDLTIEEIEPNYQRFYDEEGNEIKGVKLHKGSDTLYLYGLVLWKRVLIPGYYKERGESTPLTVAKQKLRYLTPVGKFRQFKITPYQVDRISVENLSLLPPV